jgi:hypothetical protein
MRAGNAVAPHMRISTVWNELSRPDVRREPLVGQPLEAHPQ